MTDKTEVMNGETLDIAEQRRDELKQLFPGVFTETTGVNGEIVETVDFERLKAELGTFTDVYEGRRERYGMDWPGKRDCMRLIQEPTRATLKPCREESIDFDNTKNLFIEGDNLEVLKLLQKSYYSKIKMIYIDPPYNTGKDFIYPDNYQESLETYLTYSGLLDDEGKKFSTNVISEGRYHTKWLNMMYPRLYLARNLLTEDGVVFISIDEKEASNLLKLCFDIFGEENYAGEIIWKNSSKNDQAYISMQHEYMYCFVKDKSVNNGEWLQKKEGLEKIYKAMDSFWSKHSGDPKKVHEEALKWFKGFPESSPIYSSKHYSWMDKRGVYFPDNISGPNVGQYVYDVIHPVTKKVVKPPSRGWFCPEEKMLELITIDKVHFGADDTTVPCLKTYLKDTENVSLTSILFKDGRAASKRLKGLFGEQVFTNPKDEEALANIAKAIGLSDGDIALDFFAGSGSFAHSIYKLIAEDGLKVSSISVQLPEDLNAMVKAATGLSKKITQNAISYLNKKNKTLNLSELSKERMRLTVSMLRDQYGQLDCDFGFKVFSLDKSSFEQWQSLADMTEDQLKKQLELHVNHIDEISTPEEILFELLLKAGFELTENIEELKLTNKTVFSIADGALMICLEDEITAELIDAIVEAEPMQFICLDKGFNGNDQLKANAVQTFKSKSQNSESELVFKVV